MRIKITYILLAGLLMVLGACERERDFTGGTSGKKIVLELDPGALSVDTKTPTRDGVAYLHENNLGTSVDVFFFRRNNDNDVLKSKALGVEIQTNGRVVVETSDSEIKSIFGNVTNGLSCFIVVVANHPTPISATVGTTTLAQLRNTQLDRHEWNENPPESSFVMVGEQTMTIAWEDQTAARATVKMKRVACKITFQLTIADQVVDDQNNVWIPQTNSMRANFLYALKDALLGGTPQPVPGDKNSSALKTYSVYRPMQVLTDSTKLQDRTDPITGQVTPQAIQLYFIPVKTGDNTYYTGCDSPFYSYPANIETGSTTEPYIKLIIPWHHGTSTKEYYYKIPFKHMQLLKNTWYRIIVDVRILGGDDDEKAPSLGLTYSVADWSGEPAESASNPEPTTLPGEIIAARYLSVPTTEFILYNEDRLFIPIDSSSDIELVGFDVRDGAYTDKTLDDGTRNPDVYVGEDPSVYNPFKSGTANLLSGESDESGVANINIVKPNYKRNADGTPATDVTTINTLALRQQMFPTVTRKTIEFYHALKRNMAAGAGGYDIAPYTVRFRIRHKDDPTGYYSDVIIEQRPAMLIEPQRNSDHTDKDSNGHTTYDGYVMENGETPSKNTKRNNTNFNMYIIETSVLPTSGVLADYVLGDPRATVGVTYTSGKSENNFTSTYEISYDYNNNTGDARRLSNYTPANESNIYDDYIAPKFRIASSFGASSNMTRDNAIFRCATYQEDGYPAGRWRLPTVAEIVYMARLTTDKLIPRLLGSDTVGNPAYTDYWCNSAFVRITDGADATTPPVYNPSTNANSNKYVRCVYDEWYWENSDYPRIKAGKYDQFRWGDL